MSWKFTATICETDGERFAVVLVPRTVIDSPMEAGQTMQQLSPLFKGMQIVLAAKNKAAPLTYFGRADLVEKMCDVASADIPWQDYEINIE